MTAGFSHTKTSVTPRSISQSSVNIRLVSHNGSPLPAAVFANATRALGPNSGRFNTSTVLDSWSHATRTDAHASRHAADVVTTVRDRSEAGSERTAAWAAASRATARPRSVLR